jgi:hypothetical protein
VIALHTVCNPGCRRATQYIYASPALGMTARICRSAGLREWPTCATARNFCSQMGASPVPQVPG